MKYILDTHALIWFDSLRNRLSLRALRAIVDPSNEVFVSHVSILEAEIKVQTGKLLLQKPIEQIVSDQIAANSFRELPLTLKHICGLRHLPLLHRDPFDRLLISQTLAENATLITVDRLIHQYNVPILWS